jgi:chromosome segregation ATPase
MSVHNLLEAMTVLHDYYAELLTISSSKRQAIVSRNYEELLKTLNAESRKTKAIREIEDQLQQAVQMLLREKGIQSNLQLKLSEIMRLVFDPEEKSRLKDKHTALQQTLDELKAHNEFNQRLIEQSLSYIDYSMNLMTDTWEQEATYAPPTAHDKRSQARSMFDTRA